jgi:hypothetical protein
MSKNRSRRIDRDTAERLLGGGVVGPEAGQASLAGHAALAGLLAAAAAPAVAGELSGEGAALAAFREVRRNPVSESGRAAVADAARRRAFTVKAVVAALAVTAVGGVAFAAGTGSLPRALGGGPAPQIPTPGTAVHATRGAADTGLRPSAQPDVSGPPAPGTATGRPSVAPPAATDAPALCAVFRDRLTAGAAPHDVLAAPDLSPLAALAGGPEKVAGYCAHGRNSAAAPTGSAQQPAPTAPPTGEASGTHRPPVTPPATDPGKGHAR